MHPSYGPPKPGGGFEDPLVELDPTPLRLPPTGNVAPSRAQWAWIAGLAILAFLILVLSGSLDGLIHHGQ